MQIFANLSQSFFNKFWSIKLEVSSNLTGSYCWLFSSCSLFCGSTFTKYHAKEEFRNLSISCGKYPLNCECVTKSEKTAKSCEIVTRTKQILKKITARKHLEKVTKKNYLIFAYQYWVFHENGRYFGQNKSIANWSASDLSHSTTIFLFYLVPFSQKSKWIKSPLRPAYEIWQRTTIAFQMLYHSPW